MRKIYILILLTFFCFIVTQNINAQIILNGSFENPTTYTPFKVAEVSELEYWIDDATNVWIGSVPTILWHSPDWFDQNETYANNPLYFGSAATGSRFIAMNTYELIEQEINKTDFKPNTDYRISMKVKLSSTGNTPNWSLCHLRVYLAKSKIEYKSTTQYGNDETCEQDYIEHKNGLFQQIDIIMDKNIANLGLLPGQNWYTVSHIFTSPSNALINDYNWIGIELVKPNYVPDGNRSSCSEGYLFIDDFSIDNACDLNVECSSIKGVISPILKQNHSETNPWSLSNIANVSNVKIEILNALGQSVITPIVKHSTNGFTKPIYWNGLNDLGSPVVTGTYMARVTLSNDCGEKQFSQQFVKTTLNTNPSVIETQTYYVNNIKTPKQCCEYAPDFYLNNTILDGPGKLEYKVTGNIYVGNNVTTTANADVLLQAGNEIIFDDGVTIGGDGSVFETELVPCVAALRPANNNVSENVFEGNSNLITEINSISPINVSTFTTSLSSASKEIATSEIKKQSILNKTFSSLTIYPNPNKGEFVLELSNAPKGNYSLQITDALGRSVIQQQFVAQEQNLKQNINLQAYGKGIYFIKISSEQINEVRKIVVE